MISQFDIKDLENVYQKVFGIRPQFNAEFPPTQYNTPLGSRLYHRDELGRNYYLPVKLGGLELSLPVISLKRRKNIVETVMVNRNGSVNELISADDFKISIRGLCVGDGTWPEDALRRLQELEERNEALSIDSALTNLFLVRPDRKGSDKVIILSLDIMETKGFKNIVPYQIELKSDASFELVIK